MTVEAALSNNDIYSAVPIVEIDGQVNDMVQTLFHGMDMSESDLGMTIPDSELKDSPIGDAFAKAQRADAQEIAVRLLPFLLIGAIYAYSGRRRSVLI